MRVHVPADALSVLDVELPAEASFSRRGWFDSSLELAVGLEVTEYLELLPDNLEVEGLLWPVNGQ